MKNRIWFFIKKHWLLAWIMMAAVIISTLTAFAAYDSSNSVMKRVIVASDGKSTGFTSNLLEQAIGVDKYLHRTLYRTESNDKRYIADVIIRNHLLDYPDYPYEKDIEYNLTATITDSNGNIISDLTGFGGETGKKITIQDSDGTELAVLPSAGNSPSAIISSQKIEYEKGKPGSLRYRLVFDNWDIENDTQYCVKVVTALKNRNQDYSDLSDIGGVIGLKKNQDLEENGWDAFLNETQSVINGKIDAFNLVLTGSGAAEITIQWDTTKISLNHLFRGIEDVFDLKNGEVTYTPPANNETWATLIVHADTNDAARGYRNYYDIQVYSTGAKRIHANNFQKLTPEAPSANADSWITVKIEDS